MQTPQKTLSRISLRRVSVAFRDHQTGRSTDRAAGLVDFPPIGLGVDDGTVREGARDAVRLVGQLGGRETEGLHV